MKVETLVPVWGSMICANVWLAAGSGYGLIWLVVAIVFAFVELRPRK